MARYHWALVALHWLMALMILMALAAGRLLLDPMPNDDPEKASALAGHMTFGLIIGSLLILRFAVRLGFERPPHAETGNAMLDTIGKATHWAFYLLILGMVMSGMGVAQTFGLFPIAFGGSGEAIADDFTNPARAAHGIFSMLLMLLIVLHIAAAVYHQVVLRDGLLRRMWFGRRAPD